MTKSILSRKKSSTSIKRVFKRVPGLVHAITWARIARRRTALLLTKKAILWCMSTQERRAFVFEALPEQFIFANNPTEKYIVSTKDQIIGKKLYTRGSFDFQKFEAAISLIRSNRQMSSQAILIDVGANIGSIAIPALRRGYVKRCIAFELDPTNARLLAVNAILNEVENNIDIRNLAVGNDIGSVAIQYSSSNFGDHRVRKDSERNEAPTVGMIKLNSIVDELDLANAILWMDIQGYEAYALQGASEFIKAGVPLITEFSPEELRYFNALELFIDIIIGSHYRFMADLNARNPRLFPANKENLWELSDNLDREAAFTDLLFLA